MKPNSNENSNPVDAIKAARELWLEATTPSELEQVETLYRQALSSKHPSSDDDDDSTDEPAKKKKRNLSKLSKSDYLQASEKLALLLCQSGRSKKAKKPLASLGFKCRLAENVLNYSTEIKDELAETGRNDSIPCQIIDDFLSKTELQRLISVFSSPSANYWTSHNYQVEPPSPYFSYVIPMSDIKSDKPINSNDFGFLGNLIKKIQSCPMLTNKFPTLSNETRFVEMWAHNRPHASGHQMHFDSDDEGRGGVRNPIISTILYITTDDSGDSTTTCTGGPSLVTNQKLGDVHLATRGWMAHPKSKRLVAFDGRYLHGVVPGKGVDATKNGRRVTLMFAFWKDITIRRGIGPGSARPFPLKKNHNAMPKWAIELTKTPEGLEEGDPNQNSYQTCKETIPVEFEVVYETLDGRPWKKSDGMPSYNEVFQGF
ncbi:hypothetical protein HJC23_012436 [Cyclotella cryptica]|uniref:Fe2OG dioxygenase domain-containing protein n=1 Tax=Cyclotella cryptica TaxID=29204 RepID=A0ABD3Q3U8_9STRA|eukprot:CCRYP_009376-RA/>CCRYP_009376-RA protein AED:0.40 eAED:0.40 QI:0/-1/0/1/-1/1/1/0/428